MDSLAGKPFSVSCYVLRSTQTEISQEVDDIIWLDARIHSVCDCVVHLVQIRKWTIAVPNNVEVPEVKVRREPRFSHSIHSLANAVG
jgi:hypothetical protein